MAQQQTSSGDVGLNEEADYQLALYVVCAASERSVRAIRNISRLCQEELPGRFELTIIDLVEHPEMISSEQILATPTLIRRLPKPQRRVVGDLSVRDALNATLGVGAVVGRLTRADVPGLAPAAER